jgi:hypothetical protein
LDDSGSPKRLQIGEPSVKGSFSELARDSAGDIPPTTLIRELVRMGAVEKDGETVSLVSSRLLPKPDDSGVTNIKIAGDAASDFLSTVNNNLDPNERKAFERRVVGDGLSSKDIQEFCSYAETLADSLLEELNSWVLERKKRALSERGQGEEMGPTGRVGLGAYLFQDRQVEE